MDLYFENVSAANQKPALGGGEEGEEESGVDEIGLDVNITSSPFISREHL